MKVVGFGYNQTMEGIIKDLYSKYGPTFRTRGVLKERNMKAEDVELRTYEDVVQTEGAVRFPYVDIFRKYGEGNRDEMQK